MVHDECHSYLHNFRYIYFWAINERAKWKEVSITDKGHFNSQTNDN